jgi:hypothetical protein
MPRQSEGKKDTIERVMHEFKHGELESSSGDKVKSRKQAVAIALSESGSSNREDKKTNEHNYRRTKAKEGADKTAQQEKEGTMKHTTAASKSEGPGWHGDSAAHAKAARKGQHAGAR